MASTPERTPEKEPTLGSYLRSLRESKGLTINSVARYTKIGATNIELLEGDLFDQLPNKAYLTGHVKSYSKFLGVDEEEVLKLLNKAYERFRPLVEKEEGPPALPKAWSFSVKKRHYLFPLSTALALVVLSALFFREKQFNPLEKEAHKPIPEPVTILKETSPLSPKLEEAPAKIEKKVEPVKERKFFPMVRELYSIDIPSTEEERDLFVPPEVQAGIVSGQQNLYITAIEGKTWLAFKIDDQPIRRLTLLEGEDIFIHGNEIRLFLGNLPAVKIFLNNELLKVSSRNGIKNIVFPQENRRKYAMPLFVFNQEGNAQTSEAYMKEKGIPWNSP